jgi:hypothetical protein
MTAIGKLCVLITVTLSLVFLTLALATVTNRLDWFSYKKENGDQVIGIVAQREARIKDLVAPRDTAEARSSVATAQLVKLEDMRPRRAAWYANQLVVVQTGKEGVNKVADPVKELPGISETPTNPGIPPGLIDIEPMAARAVVNVSFKGKDGPALPIDEAFAVIQQRQADILAEQKAIEMLIKEHAKLTAQIATPKTGLRDQINMQLGYQAESRAEAENLLPLLTNRTAEANLLLRRTGALERRLEELKKAGLAEK